MQTLIINIEGLVQVRDGTVRKVSGKEMQELPVIQNAFLLLNKTIIEAFGEMKDCPEKNNKQVIDASNRFVLPSFIDSHTHIVFAKSREEEFVDRIKGLSYQEIAAKGGGILNSAKRLQKTSEEDLFRMTSERVKEIMMLGTGALEIKSGYGLTTRDEIKMLRVARRIEAEFPILVKKTFLGAHAIPKEYANRRDYIEEVINEMIPEIVDQKLAQYIDVFCEEGFFTQDESVEILLAGKRHGLTPKVHANQLNRSGGVQAGVKTGAISVDHLECVGDEEIKLLQGTATMPTLLPGAAYFLNTDFPPARKMIDNGLPVSLASDYNPGSSPTGSMPQMISMACINMKMTPEEAINAATINAAYAMQVSDLAGSITTGKLASVIITKKIPSISFIPYAFGSNWIDKVFHKGKETNYSISSFS
jgi:imidazolonepropionase